MSGDIWAVSDVITVARANQKTLVVASAEPATMYPGMLWFDTDDDKLKERDNANGAWIERPGVTLAATISGLWTFNRGAAVPFAVDAASLKVTNLDADLLDGQHRAITINADHTHQSTGAQGGKLDHGLALDGLGDDDHTQYIKHSLATALSDFLVASGAGAYVKKTLAEVKTILGLGTAAYTASSDYAVAAKGVTNGDTHNHAGGDGAQIDHGGLGGLADDDHTQYLKEEASGGTAAETPDHTHQAAATCGKLDHGLALDGLGDDDHTIYQLVTAARAWTGDLLPDATNTRKLGNSTGPKVWSEVHGTNFYGSVRYADMRFLDLVCVNCGERFRVGDGLKLVVKGFEEDRVTGLEMLVVPVHCFVPGTTVGTIGGDKLIEKVKVGDLVLTHRGRYRPVLQLHRSRYAGEVAMINRVGTTPNHPFLTPEGWVRADRINDDSYVLAAAPNRRKVQLAPTHTQPDEAPSAVGENDLLPSIVDGFMGGGVPVPSIDLNGKTPLRKSNVNVVDVDRIFGYKEKTCQNKRIHEHLLKRRDEGSLLPTLRMEKTLRSGHGSTSRNIMRSANLSFPLLGTHLAPPQMHNLALPSMRDTREYKSIRNYLTRNVEAFGYSQHGHPFNGVEPGDLLNQEVIGQEDTLRITLPTTHPYTPTPINTYREVFNGEVFNLTVAEDESYCVGPQLLAVHNCRCRRQRRRAG